MRLPISIVLLIALLVLFPGPVLAELPDMAPYTPYELAAAPVPPDAANPPGTVDLKFKIDSLQRGTPAAPWAVEIQRNVAGTASDWSSVSFVLTATYLEQYSLGNNTYHVKVPWDAGSPWSEDQTVSYRVRVSLCDASTSPVASSPWAEVSMGIKCSPWARPDIEKAIQAGLVPDSVRSDFSRPITREEFAELAVRLYETAAKRTAEPVASSPFTDCTHPSVLKAFNLKIVTGVTPTQFKPKDLSNREQVAAMLFRTLKAIAPQTDYSTPGAPAFKDAAAISPAFTESVSYLTKSGYIKGSGGAFDPKGNCTREMAVAIAVRVFEKLSVQ